MKKIKITAFALAAVLSSTPVLAAEIPQEAVPVYLTGESVCITENLISLILEEVQNGLGFGEAWGKASREIHSAVLAGSTNGYGYADLTAIARNAILQYRDMYLRPDLSLIHIFGFGNSPTPMIYSLSTPICALYPGFNCPFIM